jgi:hypothetical protein
MAAISPVARLNRQTCRDHVVQHFSVQQMTSGYEAVYQQLIAQKKVSVLRPVMATLVSTLN